LKKLLLLLVTILLVVGCTSIKHEETLKDKVKLECEKIEGKVWEYFGKRLSIIVITNESSPEYISMIKALSNGIPVKVYQWSNLSKDEKFTVEEILESYSLPLDFPVIMVIGPPIVYINTGNPVIPPILNRLAEQHPYNLFTKPGEKYVFMFGYEINPGFFSKQIRNLISENKTVAVYYPAPYLGFANSIILNKTLGLPLNSLIVLNGDKIVKITPLKVNITRELFFYSPSCPHCENVMPYIKQLAKKMNITMYDVTKNESIAEKYSIYAVPTLIVETDKGEMRLIGESDIIAWIKGEWNALQERRPT